ncbi:beta-hexosaminidase [Musa troglodytarum]|uniref:beta-N-acetylhexosaminidase n=1 Tax=Musa troglodytarum TaxID=320322 RepID=A0A9E7FWZ9_9LILI|nr:beta-hexosaminidase [Musa troglodytarum]
MASKSLDRFALPRFLLLSLAASLLLSPSHGWIPRRRPASSSAADDQLVYLWPLPELFRHGHRTLSVDPDLALDLRIPGGESLALSEAFERYRDLIFTQWERSAHRSYTDYDVNKLTVLVASDDDTLQFGADESYTLSVGGGESFSVVNGAAIEANTVYGALRGLEALVINRSSGNLFGFLCRGAGYPDLWPSANCTEPLDVSKNFTFEVISGILTDLLDVHHYLLRLPRRGVVDIKDLKYDDMNIWFMLGPGVCPQAVAQGFRCIMSNQGVWYLDHLDVTWENFYNTEPLEGINNATQQKLVLGGEVCMWGEMVDTSNVQQTIWPRAAAAAERLWSPREATSVGNLNTTVLPRLHYFRCLLNHRGVAAAPVTSKPAREPPHGPASCFLQ